MGFANRNLVVLSHTAVLSSGGDWYIKNRNGETLVELERLGWQVTVIARAAEDVGEFATFALPKSIRVLPLDSSLRTRQAMRRLLAAYRSLRRADAAMVWMPSVLCAFLGIASRVRFVMYAGSAWGLRDDFPAWRGVLERQLAKRSEVVIGSGGAVVDYFAERAGARSILAVPQVPSEVVERLVGGQVASNKVDAVRILFVGSVARLKGIAELTEALRRLPTLECRIVGPIADQGLADALAEVPGVSLEGYADWDTLKSHYEWATVLVLPSYTEGLPRVIHEATAFGAALVVTPVGGVPSLLTDRRDALFVKVGDESELYEALSSLVANPERIPALVEGARQALAPLFASPSNAKQFDDQLRALSN